MVMVDIRSLYDKMVGLVPVKRSQDNTDDFRKVLSSSLSDYLDIVKELRSGNVISDNIVKEVEKTIVKLNEIVAAEYKGLNVTAFNKLSNLLFGDNKDAALGNSIKITELAPKEVSFYRMRVIENRRGVSYQDMFHIPLTLRGQIPTNRFSSPGYPCLYLGTSVYACWEEMGRPMLSQSMVSLFENQERLSLVDLRIPTYNDWVKEPIPFLRAFPLLIACSVTVKNQKDLFKPEYIIPHLLMDFIIYNNVNRKGLIHGIYYTSVFKNSDFGYDNNKFENVAIPVIKALTSKKYCSELCRMFKLTNPTCDEIEQARTGGYNTVEFDKSQRTLTFHQGIIGKYPNSSFGNLEKRLKDISLFPLFQIEDK